MSNLIFCCRCGTYKPASEYYSSINRSWCKPCRRAYSAAKYAALPPDEKAELMRIFSLKRRQRTKRVAVSA